MQALKQVVDNGINPDNDTLLSAARAIHRGFTQQASISGLEVFPVTRSAGGWVAYLSKLLSANRY